jgi:hypothetical protein
VQAPTGFIPQQDQGYLINIIQLPPAPRSPAPMKWRAG